MSFDSIGVKVFTLPNAMKRATLILKPTPPYDFSLTASSATHFRGRSAADSFEGGVFRRLLDLQGRLCLVSVRSLGTIDSPSLELEVKGAPPDNTIMAAARDKMAWILGIDQDLVPFYRLANEDPILTPMVQAMRGLHVTQSATVFEALILAILGQQISSHVASILRTLLVETYGKALKISGVTYHSFPRPDDLVVAGVDGLRSVKFSARKAQYILDISTAVASCKLDLEGLKAQPEEQVIKVLSGLRGVGLWTVQWLFIRTLGRTDGFPHSDLALCRTLGQLVNAGTPFSPEDALDYSHRWSPFRSYVTAYLFAAIRSGNVLPSTP